MSETEMAEPEWLEGLDDRAKLTAIMAAVRRCHLEHAPGSGERTGPHMSTSVAELFIGQMLILADARIRADERERIRELAEKRGATYAERVPCGCADPSCGGAGLAARSFADLIGEDG